MNVVKPVQPPSCTYTEADLRMFAGQENPVARPPLKAAHDHAVKELVKLHNEEWQQLVNAYLDAQGWKQEEVVKQVWKAPVKGA